MFTSCNLPEASFAGQMAPMPNPSLKEDLWTFFLKRRFHFPIQLHSAAKDHPAFSPHPYWQPPLPPPQWDVFFPSCDLFTRVLLRKGTSLAGKREALFPLKHFSPDHLALSSTSQPNLAHRALHHPPTPPWELPSLYQTLGICPKHPPEISGSL